MAASPLRAFGSPRPHFVRHPFEDKANTRKRRKFKEKTRELPKTPGVYFFYGHRDRLLYIGKAKCLRERVRSYFADTSLERPAKIRRLLAEIERFEIQEVGSELEALLLERRLIADRQPLLNRQHKRFMVYPYLLLSDESFPRLTVTRAEPLAGEKEEESDFSSVLAPNFPLPAPGEIPGIYLGPFTTSKIAWNTLEAVRNLFPLRSCEGELLVDVEGRGCFYREIGRCCGPCVGQTDSAGYKRIVGDLVQLLQTGAAPQIENLKTRMQRLAEEWRFEDAAVIKAQLEAIELAAARLRRLNRMRDQNNAVIAQPALSENGEARTTLFLVRGGAVRRRLTIASDDKSWECAARVIRQLYEGEFTPAEFTAKEELDEMMILDRWLRSHGDEPCCAWMNAKPTRNWVSNAVRQLRRSADYC